MKIISHRGAAGLALENTLEGIRIALRLPIYAIEVDVRATKDGQLILLHDAHTGHVSGKTLIVQNSTLQELRQLRLHNGEQIPTLDEVLKLIGNKKHIMLDIKSGGFANEILQVLNKHPSARVFLSGRQWSDLKKIHNARPEAAFLLQNHNDPLDTIREASVLGARGITVNFRLVNPLTYHMARRRKLDVLVYTVNRKWQHRLFSWLYPEAVIITNHPQKML